MRAPFVYRVLKALGCGGESCSVIQVSEIPCTPAVICATTAMGERSAGVVNA